MNSWRLQVGGRSDRQYDDDYFDGEPAKFTTFNSSAVHVARKEYRTFVGTKLVVIRPGDTYRRTVVGGYYDGGGRWLEVYRYLIKRGNA